MLIRLCGDHFVIHTNIESLCCIPETNKILHVSYSSILKLLNRAVNMALFKIELLWGHSNCVVSRAFAL